MERADRSSNPLSRDKVPAPFTETPRTAGAPVPACNISQIQLRINQLVEVLRLISSGAINCASTFEREMRKTISRGAIHRARSRPPFVTEFAK